MNEYNSRGLFHAHKGRKKIFLLLFLLDRWILFFFFQSFSHSTSFFLSKSCYGLYSCLLFLLISSTNSEPNQMRADQFIRSKFFYFEAKEKDRLDTYIALYRIIFSIPIGWFSSPGYISSRSFQSGFRDVKQVPPVDILRDFPLISIAHYLFKVIGNSIDHVYLFHQPFYS